MTVLDHDEFIRGDTTMEGTGGSSSPRSSRWARWASTPPRCASTRRSRRSTTCTTPAIRSGIVDGAAAVLIGNKKIGKKLGLKPRARIVSTAVIG